jgi:hypothetical protein
MFARGHRRPEDFRDECDAGVINTAPPAGDPAVASKPRKQCVSFTSTSPDFSAQLRQAFLLPRRKNVQPSRQTDVGPALKR